MVPPEAYGGGEAFGGEQDAPPRYGKSVSSIASVRDEKADDFLSGLMIVGIAAAHFRSSDDAACPCWTCVFPSKPDGDTHHECSDGQNGSPCAIR
jgi:hypothetical protein